MGLWLGVGLDVLVVFVWVFGVFLFFFGFSFYGWMLVLGFGLGAVFSRGFVLILVFVLCLLGFVGFDFCFFGLFCYLCVCVHGLSFVFSF